MNAKYLIAGGIGLSVLAFAAGRYSVNPPAVKQETKKEVSKDEKKDKDVRTKIYYIREKRPDGTVVTRRETDKEESTRTDTVTQTKSDTVLQVTPQKRKALNISILAGAKVDNFGVPLYGVSVTKPILGPMTVGAWALNNGTVGVSLGIDF